MVSPVVMCLVAFAHNVVRPAFPKILDLPAAGADRSLTESSLELGWRYCWFFFLRFHL